MAPTKPPVPKLERVPLTALTQYPNNPRQGDVDEIRRSLERRGQYVPLVVSEDNVILKGNHTALALAALGAETALIMRALDKDGQPIHSRSQEATELVIVDNRLPDLGSYDDEALVELLQSLGDIDTLAIGFTDDDLNDLLVGLEDEPDFTITDPAPEQGSENHVGKNLLGEQGSMDAWSNAAHRIILFDLPLAQFAWAQEHLAQLSTELGLTSNRDVFLHLLAVAVGSSVPEAPVADAPAEVGP